MILQVPKKFIAAGRCYMNIIISTNVELALRLGKQEIAYLPRLMLFSNYH